MRKLEVAVLMGGKTPEYEISLMSGKEVVRNLPKKYSPLPVIISRNGKKWTLTDKKTLLSLDNPIKLLGSGKDIVIKGKVKNVSSPNQISDGVDVAFIAMHGPYGEDGTIQGMLELAGIPYTGPGVLASAIGMDKVMFRKLLSVEKLPIPKYTMIKKGETNSLIPKALGKPPYFIKPHNQGSSVGSSIVRKTKDLKKALKQAYEYSDIALVDELLEGKELTCGVMGNDNPKALPVVEIIPLKGEFFDYQSKYTESGAEEIVPAKISKELTRKIQKTAVEVFKVIGCRGFARVDFMLDKKGKPFVLEINTIPGLTPMSLMPKAAIASGLTYSQFLDKVIQYAIK